MNVNKTNISFHYVILNYLFIIQHTGLYMFITIEYKDL